MPGSLNSVSYSCRCPCFIIPFIKLPRSILKLVCPHSSPWLPVTEPLSSDGLKPSNFQPKYIHGELTPIYSFANTVLKLKKTLLHFNPLMQEIACPIYSFCCTVQAKFFGVFSCKGVSTLQRLPSLNELVTV